MIHAFGLLVLLGVAVLFFWIGREIIGWYFKLNQVVDLLEKIEKRLAKNT